eukprot:2443622-Rhodomonas_salina.2
MSDQRAAISRAESGKKIEERMVWTSKYPQHPAGDPGSEHWKPDATQPLPTEKDEGVYAVWDKKA